tara:strand:- start:3210 stop:4244 length:1035 start_codon:yes stop_codon:yes gene_type:complete
MSRYGSDAEVSGSIEVAGAATFNEGSQDVDFRVESDSETHMLFIDSGNGRVGIAESAPQATLHITGPSDGDVTVLIQSKQDASLSLVADTDNTGGEDQNPSIYMSQETNIAGAYQFLMGLEGTAGTSYVGSYANQPFILSKNSAGSQLRTFQIATDDGGDVSSRFSIANGGKIAIGDGVQSADTRLHITEAAGDIFKMENTTAYGITHGQLVKQGLTISAPGSSPIDTTLNLPARSMIDTVLVTIKTVGVGTSCTIDNISLTSGGSTSNMKGSSFSGISLIGNGSTVIVGTQYALCNTDQSYPAGAAAMLLPSTADIGIQFSASSVTTNPTIDVVVFYKKFDTE